MAYMYVLYHLFKKMFKAEQKYLFPSEVLVYRYTFDFVKTESINYRRQINCDLKRTEMILQKTFHVGNLSENAQKEH